MRKKRLHDAVQEVKNFLNKAMVLIESEAHHAENKLHFDSPSKLCSAVKRASLDLTRALAELRRTD